MIICSQTATNCTMEPCKKQKHLLRESFIIMRTNHVRILAIELCVCVFFFVLWYRKTSYSNCTGIWQGWIQRGFSQTPFDSKSHFLWESLDKFGTRFLTLLFNKSILLPTCMNVCKNCWVSGKQCRPSAASDQGLQSFLRPVCLYVHV